MNYAELRHLLDIYINGGPDQDPLGRPWLDVLELLNKTTMSDDLLQFLNSHLADLGDVLAIKRGRTQFVFTKLDNYDSKINYHGVRYADYVGLNMTRVKGDSATYMNTIRTPYLFCARVLSATLNLSLFSRGYANPIWVPAIPSSLVKPLNVELDYYMGRLSTPPKLVSVTDGLSTTNPWCLDFLIAEPQEGGDV